MRVLIRGGKYKDIVAKIIAIALPMVVQGIVFQIQSLTDKAFLGNLDSVYIAALGAAQFPFNTTIDSLFALCTGVVIIVSQLFGAGKKQNINKYVKSVMFFNTLICIGIFVLWFVFSRQIFTLLNVDEKIVEYCIRYVRICSVYFFFLGCDCTLQAMLQGLGNTKPIMLSGILKVVLNILISWVLIFGHFGFPALNMDGAAIGALVANIISTVFIAFYCFVIKRKEYRLQENHIQWIDFEAFQKAIRLGIPTGLEFFLWNASNLVLIGFLNSFSYLATTIYTLTFGIEVIVYAIFSGTSKAAMTLIGHSIGAHDNKSANQQLMTCMSLNFLIVMAAIITFILFPTRIINIFTNDAKIVGPTVPFLIFTAFIMLPKSLNVVIGNGIRAHGDTKWMLYSQIIGSVFVILCSCTLVKLFHLNITAIYITLLLDEAIRAAINYWHYAAHNKIVLAEECST